MKKLIIITIISLLFVISCSINKFNKEELFYQNIEKWHNFTLKGIITINYKQFQFIKNIKILKNRDIMKIFLYDSGILGLKNKSLLKIEIGNKSEIKGQFLPVELPNISIKKIDELIDSIKYEKNKIILSKSYFNKNITILFTDKFEILLNYK